MGNDAGLGNAASPWATLSRALLDGANDWISLVDAPTAPDAPPGSFAIGPGVTISSKTDAPVPLKPLAALELQAGARLRRLSIDCTSLLNASACVIVRGKNTSLQRTSVAHSTTPGLHIKYDDASVDVEGGSFVEATILADAKGAGLRIRGATFLLPAGEVGGIETIDPSPGSQTVEVGSDDAPTTFSSAGKPWVRVRGAKSASVRNVTGSGGGSSAAGKVSGAIDLRDVTDSITLDDFSMTDVATGLFAAGANVTVAGGKVTNADIGAVLSGPSTKATIASLGVQGAKSIGVRFDAGTVTVPGTLDVKWAATGPFVSKNPLVGIEIGTSLVTISGSTTVEHCGGTSIRQLGGKLVAVPVAPAVGLRVHDSQGSALEVLRGEADLTGGGFTESEIPGDFPGIVRVASFVSSHVTLRGTTFAFNGSTQVPTPSPLALSANISPKKHTANPTGEKTIVSVPNPPGPERILLRLEVVNGPNPSVNNYIELLPLP